MADDATREAFLSQANIAVLSTIGPGGGPHAVPIWYLYEDGVFRISISRGSQKHKNVEREPRVALVVDQRERPYYSLTVMGSAEIGPGFTPDERLRLATRYLGDELGKQYTERSQGGDAVTIVFRADRLLEYETP